MSTPAPSMPPPAPPRPSPADARVPRTVPDEFIDAVLVTDRALALRLKAEREVEAFARRDEVWDGIYVMSPLANVEHQIFVSAFHVAFVSIIGPAGEGFVLPGVNLSDREEGWLKNFRIPDVAVYLAGNPARNCGTHMCGGPDLAVEVLSEDDAARGKLDFYARVGTRELLLLDRDPWALELYRLVDGKLVLVGTSTPDTGPPLGSQVLPLTFRLDPGQPRPTLEIGRVDGGPPWRF